jgi:hypothetical protein
MPADKNYADVTIFPDHNIIIRTPAGREYRGKVLEHASQHVPDEVWLQIQFLKGVSKTDQHDTALLEQRFNKEGRPAYFPAESKAEPLDAAFNRLPLSQRNDKNHDTLISDLWDADGLWTLLIKPSKSDKVLYAGSALPSKTELAYGDSKIGQFQRPDRPGAATATSPTAARPGTPGDGPA